MGFRYRAVCLARELGLTGWVRNLADGRVELELQGSPVQMRRLLLGLKQDRYIRIQHLEVEEIPPLTGERRFEVRGGDFG